MIWPPATVTVVRRVPGSKTPTPVGEAVAAVLAALDADQQALYDEARARADATAPGTWPPWPRRSRRRRPDSPGCRGTTVGADGEAKANEVGVTVRCLIRADGSVPDAEDEPDLVAVPGPLVLSGGRSLAAGPASCCAGSSNAAIC